MRLNLYNLSKEQISAIKGIAIIMIVLHNFIHLQSGVQENEMYYSRDILIHMLEVTKLDYSTLFNNILSYFGHFGVQLFIFVSGYGLTKKYLNKERINYKKFIAVRLIKIYSLVVIGLLFYFLLTFRFITFNEGVAYAISTLLMTKNFTYGTGPWWFFGFIIQMYLLFPILFSLMKKGSNMFFVLLFLSYCLMYFLHPIATRVNVPIYANFPGHLPEFLFGIGLAMYPKFILNTKCLLVALVVFIISNLSVYTFPLSFLSACIILLFLYQKLYLNSSTYIYKALIFIGNISMIMFAINGLFRGMVYTRFFDGDFSPLYLSGISILYLIFIVAISYPVSLFYNKTAIPLCNRLTEKIQD